MCGTTPATTLATPIRRSALLDQLCTEIGRDPDAIGRSLVLSVPYDQPRATRDATAAAGETGHCA